MNDQPNKSSSDIDPDNLAVDCSPAHPSAEVRKLLLSRSGFHDSIREAFHRAATSGCKELWLCDVNFSDWPLSEIRVIDSLTQWAFAHRRLRLFALDYSEFHRRHPRWVAWRRNWSHIVECRSLNDLEPTQVPTLMLAPGLVTVRLFDPVHYRGSVSGAESDALNARELLEAVAQRSVEAFPATTLGL